MANRLTDTEIWDKEWFQNLEPNHKLLFKFLCDKCDCAGIWEPNYKMATFIIGAQITEKDVLSINSEKEQVQKLNNGKFFISDFISFQQKLNKTTSPYLNPKNNCHKGILKRLIKNNIDTSPYLAPSEGQGSPIEAPKQEYIKLKDVEFVNLTQDDFDKIAEKNGAHGTLRAIMKLENWLAVASTSKAKNARGKHHKDYFKAGSWVWGDEKKNAPPTPADYSGKKQAVTERG